MCGIAGIVSFVNDGHGLDNLPGRLQAMCDAIIHRGPDEQGSAINEGVGLGMRRLSIIDLTGGSQPIYNEDRKILCVFNGEIYNYRELREELEQKGHRFSTNSDTEVIVHGYEEYGDDFPSRLNGMFAIAVHDTARRRLLLVRDHMGIKPLYYYKGSKGLVFGSEIKSLLASGLVKRQLDVDGLGQFLAWEYVPGNQTLFRDLVKLEPAHLLAIDLDSPTFTPHAYWDIPVSEPSQLSPGEWEEQVDSLLKTCVTRQLVSDVPLGAFLSGGVDSSLIVAAMGEANTFSIGFDDPSYNELRWAQAAARHLNVNHTDEILSPDILDLFWRLLHFMDEPIGDFSIFPTYLVSALARKHVTVALSGDGGDELFGGYETYIANQRAAQYMVCPSLIRKKILEPALRAIGPQAAKKGLINKARRFIEGINLSPHLHHCRWRIFTSEAMLSQLLTPEASGQLRTPVDAHITKLFAKARGRDPLNQCLYVDAKSYLCDNILTKVDRMSMAVSLETRVPYLDPELVSLAFSIPPELKVAGNETKSLLKKVAARHIPRECVYRPKEGFSIPIKHWLTSTLRPLMNELLDEQQIRQQGIFTWETISRLKNEHLQGKENHSHQLWSLIMFHAWQKKWLEGK
ncbi:asparagine synthase (glutamine-hydrolyzing) [Desulforhopalus sp. IMCC35007]|uniref:asparagine synthase (glutamine-hydrolyzing) n=1 Tax=Desulforhopalus sp. IMCC35007 TaxID=2569543 RepID=UPI0010ADEE9C|nr:asparagine synthase (glutamine-hydrolyzing) [Desulforhopalus sp. IMCC35007]TKB07608.1 asparagine synthase (glutamine-hydrolyzing) [Desulforhopalus sp. IMCC35007]